MSYLMAVAGLIRTYEEGGDEALRELGIDPNGEIAAKLHEIVIANQQLADALEKGDPEGEEHSLRGVASDAGRELSRTLHSENKGLYHNVNKRRKEGKSPKKRGDAGYPSDEAWEKSAQTAKEDVEIARIKRLAGLDD